MVIFSAGVGGVGAVEYGCLAEFEEVGVTLSSVLTRLLRFAPF